MEVDERFVVNEETIAKALALFDDDDIKYIHFEQFDIHKSDDDAVKENPDDNVKVKKIGGKKYDTNN